MFSSVTSDPIGFDTVTPNKKESDDKSVQVDLPVQEKQVQTVSSSSREIQTEKPLVQTNESAEFCSEKLASFLSKVTPSVLNELDKIEKSKAFTLYVARDNDSNEQTKELYRLKSNELPQSDGMVVSKLDWSCTGNVVAVGFGVEYHPEWCTHPSAVHFYNISRYNFNGSSPSQVVFTESCVTAMAYHPFEPYIIAVGTYSGEVIIWNLQKEGGDMRFENSISHDDKVTQVVWASINTQLHLFTSSLDGHIFSFKISPGLGSTILVDRYTFPTKTIALRPGVTSIAFQNGQMGVFVTALEGGKLIQCSTIAASEMADGQSSVVVKDPTVKYLKSEIGFVECISFSHYTNHLFCTAAGEKKIVIRSLNEKGPLNEVWTDFEVTGLSWSLAQGNALFLWGSGGQILVYDSESGRLMERMQPEESQDLDVEITTSAQNRKSPKLLAVGSGQVAYIWEIPRFFTPKFVGLP